MLFSYPELETETYDNQRWYLTPNGPYPSVTTVLSHTQSAEKIASLERWRESMGHEKADAYTKARAEHGTVVHLLAERFLKNEQVDAPINDQPVSEDDLGAFRALKTKLKHVTKVYGQEVTLFSSYFEIAGRCDLIGEYKNKPVIIDYKTAGRIKSEKDIYDYKLQLAFYGRAHNEMFGTSIEDGVVLMVANGGFPMEFNFKLKEFEAPLKERASKFWHEAINKLSNS